MDGEILEPQELRLAPIFTVQVKHAIRGAPICSFPAAAGSNPKGPVPGSAGRDSDPERE